MSFLLLFNNSQSAEFVISGVTRGESLSALGGCDVHLFRTSDDTELAQTTSDVNGAYSITLGSDPGACYIVAYKAGSPDVFGTTLNTLTLAAA